MIMTINKTNQLIKFMASSTKKLYFKDIFFPTKNCISKIFYFQQKTEILKVFCFLQKRGYHCQKCQIPIFSQIWLKKTQKTDQTQH